MSEKIVADFCSAVDDDVGQQDGVVADDHVFIDNYVGAEVSVLAYFGFSMDDCGGMDSGGVAGRLVEKFDRLGPRQIGILAAQHSCGNGGEVFGDYYG